MHIPDGFIPISQCLVYYVILIVALYFSVKWARSNLDEKRIPLLAVLAAGIFAHVYEYANSIWYKWTYGWRSFSSYCIFSA